MVSRLAVIMLVMLYAACGHEGSQPLPTELPPLDDSPPVFSELCLRPPSKSVEVFFDDHVRRSSRRVRATVSRILKHHTPGYTYELRDASGMLHRLGYLGETPMEGVREGETYEFDVQWRGDWTSTSSIVVSDDFGVVFATASEVRGGLSLGGFQFALQKPACPSRVSGGCLDALYNLSLLVSRGGDSVELLHGQKASLGGYEIHCLIAQEPVYSNKCVIDFGLIRMAFLLYRQ